MEDLTSLRPTFPAGGIRLIGQFLKAALQAVPEQQTVLQKPALSGDILYGFRHLNGAYDPAGAAQSREDGRRRSAGKETGEAGGPSGNDGGGLPLIAADGTVE